jgi:hypothetical protein
MATIDLRACRKKISGLRLRGGKPDAQRNWIKVIRGLIAFGKTQGECSVDVSAGIKPTRGPKSMGHMTWKPPQIEKYRGHHKVGTMARCALELMLNIAARRGDAHKIGRPHLSFDADNQLSVLTWRPGKTLRTTGKSLTIPVLPSLQAALDGMPKTDVLAFLTTDYGRPFKSAAAFGNKFADWCVAAGLQPVECDDGKTRNFRAHGLRKAALYTLYKLGGTVAQLQALGGHGSIAELQKYIQEIEQDEQAVSGMALVAASQAKKRTGSDLPISNRWLTAKQATENTKKVLVVAIPAGFEPATHGVEIRYSIQLSYGTVTSGHLASAGIHSTANMKNPLPGQAHSEPFLVTMRQS